jgi:tetratricopeptide (TPR) repeat protein
MDGLLNMEININTVTIELFCQIHDIVIRKINEGKNGEAMKAAQTSLYVAQLLNQPLLIANSLNQIGLLHIKEGDLFATVGLDNESNTSYQKGLECYYEALRINKNILGDDCLEAAMVLGNIATYFAERQLYKEAETCYEEALRIKEMRLSPEHQSLVKTRQNLVLLYQHLGMFDKASKLKDKGLKFTERESWLPKDI